MISTLILAAAAASTQVSCPMTLPRETVTVHAPPGWIGYARSFVRLTGFGMMADRPETLTYLVPSKSSKGEITWNFAEGVPRWLYCTYDDSAVIQISRELPPTGASCTITYTKTKQEGITAMAAACR